MSRHETHFQARKMVEKILEKHPFEVTAFELFPLLVLLVDLLDPMDCPHCAHREREHK